MLQDFLKIQKHLKNSSHGSCSFFETIEVLIDS